MRRSFVPVLGALLASCLVTLGSPRAFLPAAAADRDVAFEANVLYAQADGEDLHLDVAWPARANAPAPGIVVIHGGGWTTGDKKSLDDFIRMLAASGYPAATISYRFAPKQPWPAQIEDAKAAVRYLRQHAAKFAMDPERIGAIGFSAGAHLAMMLGVTGPADGLEGTPAADAPSSRVQAVVSWFGPTDLSADDYPAASKALIDGLVGPSATAKARRAASPIAYLDPGDAPMLVLQGTKDPIVPVSQAIAMSDALTAARARGEVRLLVGAGHGFAGEVLKDATAESLRWFERVLGAPPPVERTFTNPICAHGADPSIVRWNDFYYFCRSEGDRIFVAKAARLQDIGHAPDAAVWTPPPDTPYSREIWAPEIHRLDGRWYIYFAGDDGDNVHHRMYVLEGDAEDPQKPFTFKGKIAAPTDKFAIDGTVLVMANDRKYFVWSGWEGDQNIAQNLYIAPMGNPWTISGERVCISKPEFPWELNGKPLINEGPAVLRNAKGSVFVIYSASASWMDDYCLGQLALVGADPMKPASWAKKESAVFTRTADVFGPGSCTFVQSPDGRQDWIVYHAARHQGGGWDRDVRMQQFRWTDDGSPDFGAPVAPGVALPEPSGQR